MTALRKTLHVEEEPVVAAKRDRGTTRKTLRVITTTAERCEAAAAEPEVEGHTLKNIALFLAAPFIGLAYLVALPFVGLAVLAWLGARAAAKCEAVRTAGLLAKNAALPVAAPLAGLAYIVLFPLIGVAMLAWIGRTALVGHV